MVYNHEAVMMCFAYELKIMKIINGLVNKDENGDF